jgi:DNA-directed RNA polymerase II subunit RPB2
MVTLSPNSKVFQHILEKWKDEYGVNHHHIQSFNQLISSGLRHLIDSTPIHFTTSKGVEVQILIDNIYVSSPYIYDESRKKIPITPQDARQKNLTYSSPIYISIVEIKNGVRNHYDRIVLANLPIMVRSKYCILSKYSQMYNECLNDPGGYFIINGIDRVLVTQQRNNYNMVYVFEDKNYYRAEIRSMSEDTNHSVLVQANIHMNGNTMSFSLPHIKNNISLSILMIAMGVSKTYLLNALELLLSSDLVPEIWASIQYAVHFMFRESDSLDIQTNLQALEYIGNLGTKITPQTNPVAYAQQVIDIELFPHLGVFSDLSKKVELLIYMAYRLFMVQHKQFQVHDKDNLSQKRFENSGILIGELFKSLYRSCISELENDYEKNTSVVDIFNKFDSTITKNIKYCFSTGKWGVQRNTYIRQGVSQVLNRLSFIAMISHLQRIVIPVGKEGKNFKIRQIHPTSFGYTCMYETPEGQSCGIVLNMTLCTRTSEGHSYTFIHNILMRRLEKYIHSTPCKGLAILFLNGMIIGYIENPKDMARELKTLRLRGILPIDVSIGWDWIENEIRLYCDKGRLIRPFLTQKGIQDYSKLSEIYTFSEAVEKGYIEWLDSNEVQTLVITMYPHEKGDYCEIHPSLLLGACAGAIPFLDHNQSPRNVYESSMMKQAIGMFATNYQYRYDAAFHTLDYPQRSLVSTQTARLVGMHDMPAGINCIVAITTHGGWNAEDSIIINRSAIERGLFCSNAYHTYAFEDKTYKGESFKKICIPPSNIQKPEWNYYHLDANGIVRKGAVVSRNDVIIGQVYQSVEYVDGDRVEHLSDCSELSEEEGIIDRVEIIDTPNGNRLVKIIIRQVRIPEIGDKFANMAAQKGTCALIIPQEDMPFTGDGIVPDVMMNSHALPSRMTISMLLEMVVGKTCLLKGELGDATPFSDSSINIAQRLDDVLVQNGFEKHGWETMYSGQTGKPLRSKIFIGTSYYQKLKHMVTDKIHARSYGNVTSLTRQPLAGRSKDGGLRLGEMERDCLLSHGSVQFLRERLFDMSDAFSVLICNECGVISNSKDECHICKNNELIQTNAPYASKLLFQMLNGCLIKTKFHSVTE